MAFDQKTRNLLQRTVAACRDLLAGPSNRPEEGEFMQQLQKIYGINPDGTATPVETLGTLANLSDEDMQIARLLRHRLDHLAAGLVAGGKTLAVARREAVSRLAREQAFTLLNRLAALRMAEEREIVLECVRRGTSSEGFELFQQTAGGAFGDTHESYRAYLFLLFDELSTDLGVLFDHWDPAGLLFPRREALEAVLAELDGVGKANKNGEFTPEQFAEIWAEDETIGWIYQYYNDPEERKKMRKESAAPRNSRELAVRNQFFTPRYVVEFLTDNTLGRIWYEMTRGQTRLAEQCRYLVRRPTEIFLAEGETAPETPDQEGLSQEELLKQPVHIPHRPLKDPREIRLLDPACGSMHFGLYAFDLFETIYEEAWDNGSCPALQEAYASRDEFLQDVPRLIIEHNIHGIDIDPRAVQIAGLSLWLRAQKAWQARGVKPADRPRVRRSNIVCAEPMPGSPEMLEEFVATLDPPLLGELVKTVFDKMQLAGEAGSLLKIEEEIRTAIDTARKEWLKQQDDLLTRKDGSQEEFFDTAEQQVIDALRAYAEQADADSYQRRLFADDAARGFAFIDLCRKRYDAVVMNPPFGEFCDQIKKLAKKHYPGAVQDILAAMVSRGLDLNPPDGMVGAITSRACMFQSTFADWREHYILGETRMTTIADLGSGVMDDAAVDASAYTISRSGNSSDFLAIRALKIDPEPLISSGVLSAARGTLEASCYIQAHDRMGVLPGSPIAYWCSNHVLDRLAQTPPLLSNALLEMGMSTKNDDRWVRTWWEIPIHQIGWEKRYRRYAKGADSESNFGFVYCVVNTEDNFRGLHAELIQKYPYLNGSSDWIIHPEYHYGVAGLTYGRRVRRFIPVPLPEGIIFSENNPAIFPASTDARGFLAVLLASRVTQCLLAFIAPPRILDVGYVSKIPTPIVDAATESEYLQLFDRASTEGLQYARRFEISPYYLGTLGEPSKGKTYEQTIEAAISSIDQRVAALLALDSEGASNLLGEFDAATGLADKADSTEERTSDHLDPSCLVGTAFGRWDIRYATGERQPPELPDPFDPLPVCPPGMLQNAEGLPAEPKDVPADYPLRISWPGILVDDENHPEDIVARVREAIEVIWKDRAEAIEQEACGILGVKTLRDYFRRPAAFFADHLKRYSKSRRQAPIYWPLSTKSGSYTLWLYYHRLDHDTLYKCLQQFVEPKIKEVEQDIHRLRTMLTADEGGTKERKQLADAETLLGELREMHAELTLWAPRWKPNLNDGVLITACPLWKLFGLPKWRKDLEACWKKLDAGDYDWAHLAYTLWPDRVREKCKKDRSLAIAHGLEELCEVRPPEPKKKRAAKKASIPTGSSDSI